MEQKQLKNSCTVIKNRGFHDFRLKPSNEAQKAPKTTPGASPGTPKATQEAPRAAPESPKSAPGEQETPGATPKSFQTRFGRSKPALAAGWAAKCRPEASWKLFWSLRGLIWKVFEHFLGAPRTSFSSFFGAVQGRGACCHCVPQDQMLGRRVPALALTIRRPPLAVRRACLRRRAFYASPCQATAPSLERFTHRAHSAGPLRPEVELTPSKVRKSNPSFVDFRCFFKTILGSKMEAKMKSKPNQNRAWAPPRRSWSRVAGRWGFLTLWGAFWAPLELRNSCPRHNAGSISAKYADRARGSKIDILV